MIDFFAVMRECLICGDTVMSGTDPVLWGFQWGRGWIHFGCAVDVGDAAKRIQEADVLDVKPSPKT